MAPLPAILVVLLCALPIMTMTIGGGSGLFYVVLFLCLIRIFTRTGGWRESRHSLKEYVPIIAALMVPLFAIGLSQYAHGMLHGPSLERGLRISLGFPIILAALLSINPAALRNMYWGMVAAAWASAGIVFWLVFPAWNRPNTPQYNAVGYGNLMMLWLFFVLCGLGWTLSKQPRLEKYAKLLTVVVVFAGVILTQTRSAWMAIPLFLFIGMWLFGHLRHPLRAAGLLIAGVAVLVAIGSTNQALRTRVAQGVHEFQECHGANATLDTSVCIRLQLWRATTQMLEAEPVFGLGSPSRFVPELEARVATGVVSPFVAKEFGEPHNDMLQMLSSYGLLGGLALALLYLVPAWFFLRRLTISNPPSARVAAAMGVALTLGFAIFGLTELMFRSMHNISLYVTLLACLLALSHEKRAA
ncbi:O-antigen ligase family protein [Achromobacter denitrificans]|uniref:O-antigen ligase family protein n=1 Tax=Achromobacter denitrificans TaxID=32002 RepID=A0ABZ3G185_ACHDE|nr:O-antigen ligase family protein [Achromobacter denitrificans]